MKMNRLFARAILSALLAVAAFGCSKNTVAPPPVVVDPAPPANSAANLVHRIEYDWQNRSLDYLQLLTSDFTFAFAEGDSAGQRWRLSPHWTRAEEVVSITNMFGPAGAMPPAANIALNLDRTFIPLPDPRPGKDLRWHRSVRSHVDLIVDMDQGSGSINRLIVVGNALFFLVRGDSAAIPPEMAAAGVGPDSTRWWLERWEDETLSEGGIGLRPMPSMSTTWGSIKARFVP